jgi:hypothetical protein
MGKIRKFEATFVTFAARDRQVIEVPEGENIQDYIEDALYIWMWENYSPIFENLQEVCDEE